MPCWSIYFHSMYKSMKTGCRRFVADLQKLNEVVSRRKENAKAAKIAEEAEGKKSDDVRENDGFMTEDAVWDAGARGAKAEKRLREKLEQRFMSKFKRRNCTEWHREMNRYVVNSGVGNMEGMGYGSFAAWMRNHRTSKSRIYASAMTGMEHFLNHWEGWTKGNSAEGE